MVLGGKLWSSIGEKAIVSCPLFDRSDDNANNVPLMRWLMAGELACYTGCWLVLVAVFCLSTINR